MTDSPARGITTAHARSMQPRIGHGHDGDPGDLRVREERVLDLGHRDVLAAADDQVLGPPGDGHVAVGVERGAIPRPEPAVGGVALGGEGGPLEVATTT